MAERRMFAKSVVLSGPFIRLPAKTQLLYFHLGMQADDEGFVSAPELAMSASKTSRKELNQLIKEEFLYRFPSGAHVIRHWFIHNNIRKDRFNPTVFQAELEQLYLYERVYQLIPQWQPNDNQNDNQKDDQTDDPNDNHEADNLATQIKLNKNKLNQNKINQNKLNQDSQTPGSGAGPGIRGDVPRLVDVICYAMEHDYVSDVAQFYNYYQDAGWMEGGRPVYNWRKLLKKWEEDHAGTP